MELLGASLECPSLEILSFVDMPRWEKWSTNSGVVFPCLRQLHIRNCPSLVEVSLETLPSLNVLETTECDSGVLKRLVQLASSVTKLDICHILRLNDVVWRGVIQYLGAVEELCITDCNEIRYLWESEAIASKFFVNLRKLKVDRCDTMVSLGEKEEYNCRSNFLTSLTMLDLCLCKNMERCKCPVNIDNLIVYKCISMTVISLPSGGQKLKSLYISGCKKLSEREWGGHEIMNNTRSMPMLEVIDINDWPDLKSITELKVLVHLTTLKLINCGSLESFPDNELSSLTLLKYLHITDCPSMDASFPRGVWPPKLHSLTIGKLKKPISEWGTQNVPTSVVELYLHGDDGVGSSCQFADFLPSSVTRLEIISFGKLKSFSMGLQRLTSLQHLSFSNCPNMVDLP
ncbi:putative disease resistance protein At3g14460 [Helianthus annuus]|uniref:putative disease resistance protein At3g14460 n=1 Tax=Helianthus annuus TaxID=4232 RepID=UPI001653239E|nr:putative disease resistance protein At3g14460 [Helianthus annuus]